MPTTTRHPLSGPSGPAHGSFLLEGSFPRGPTASAVHFPATLTHIATWCSGGLSHCLHTPTAATAGPRFAIFMRPRAGPRQGASGSSEYEGMELKRGI